MLASHPDSDPATAGANQRNAKLTRTIARRFTEYKRPNPLLRDLGRLERLLLNEQNPIQLVIAGKAHPADFPGKAMIQLWLDLARQPHFRKRVVFLEDYDIALAQDLVRGSTSGLTRHGGHGRPAEPAV